MLHTAVILLLSLVRLDHIDGSKINNFAGPYIFYANRLHNCQVPSELSWKWYMKTSHFNPKRPNQLQTLNGNITGRTNVINDDTWLKAVMDVRSNNEWKPNAFIFQFKKKACSTLRTLFPNLIFLIFGEAEDKSHCVLEPRVYKVIEKQVDWTFPVAPVLPYANYRVRVTLGDPDASPYGCFAVEGYTIPKVS